MGSGPRVSGDPIKSGDRRLALEAMRDRLADSFADASPMVIAQVAGRLQAVLKELAELPVTKAVSKSDELASRRKARRATAGLSAPSGGEGVERGTGGD